MIFSRDRKMTVHMGEYETYTFGAFASLSHLDFGISDTELATLSDDERAALHERIVEGVYGLLDEALIGEIQEAADLTDDRKSFILKAISPAKPAQPASTKAKAKPTRRS